MKIIFRSNLFGRDCFCLVTFENSEQFNCCKKQQITTAPLITPNSPNKCSAWQQAHKDSLWSRPIMCCHISTASVASLSFIHSSIHSLTHSLTHNFINFVYFDVLFRRTTTLLVFVLSLLS